LAIYLGTATPSAYKLGTANVSAIYLGSTSVFTASGGGTGGTKIAITKTSGTSTFTGSGTSASPYSYTANAAVDDATNGMALYKFTATAACTATFTHNSFDDSGNGYRIIVYKQTNSGSTVAEYGRYDVAAAGVISIAMASGNIVTFNAEDASWVGFVSLSVYTN
jgi:hypothetical protein